MSVSKDFSEADIIFNRASLALAKSQRLIASWLPPRPDEAAATKTEEELNIEESKIFLPVPELLGLGAPVPENGERHTTRTIYQSSYTEDKLRKQLLGKRASSGRHEKRADSMPRSDRPVTTKHNLQTATRGPEIEDQLGRTAFQGKTTRSTRDQGDHEELQVAPVQPASQADSSKVRPKPSTTTASKKRASSYLDEVLLARSEKRTKKEKKRHNPS